MGRLAMPAAPAASRRANSFMTYEDVNCGCQKPVHFGVLCLGSRTHLLSRKRSSTQSAPAPRLESHVSHDIYSRSGKRCEATAQSALGWYRPSVGVPETFGGYRSSGVLRLTIFSSVQFSSEVRSPGAVVFRWLSFVICKLDSKNTHTRSLLLLNVAQNGGEEGAVDTGEVDVASTTLNA